MILGPASVNEILTASSTDGDEQPDKECLFDPSLRNVFQELKDVLKDL
jgi:hypothetical protein